MRLLLDEGIDVRLRLRFSAAIDVETVPYRGWKGKKNGELLRLAEEAFDALLTLDDNLPQQQNLKRFALAVVVLRPKTQDLVDLAELVPEVERILPTLSAGEAVRVYPPSDVSKG